MSMQQTIGRDTASYRQGMVLGLTMAETLLLLVFCLLLAAAVVSQLERERLQVKSAELENVRSALVAVTSRQVVLEKLLAESRIGDDWKHLATETVVAETLEKAGLSATEIAAAAPFISAVLPLQKSGISGPEVISLVRAMAETRKALRSAGMTEVKPEQMAELVEAGVTAKAALLSGQANGQHDWPPIITLSEAKGHFFEIGSAELSPRFRKDLAGPVTKRLLQIIKDYGVDTIEVIGHTDEQPLIKRPSNLDDHLQEILSGETRVRKLVPSDNAGLGLARAVSVVHFIRQDERLKSFAILPYSGGQLIDIGGKLSVSSSRGDIRQRRRIEIRVRRSEKIDAAENTSQNEIKPIPATPPIPMPERKGRAKLAGRTLAGRASIIDGDTINIHGERIRLWGIDAIESNQICLVDGRVWRCAQDVAFGLSAHLEGQVVRCRERDRDRFGRTVATCVARGEDLGSWLVRNGLALDYPKYSGGNYSSEQLKAKAEKRGIWRGTFQMPWEWRRSRGQ